MIAQTHRSFGLREIRYALATLCILIQSSSASAARNLTTDGLDGIHFGMTVRDIEDVLGVRLARTPKDAGELCWFGVRADRIDPGIAYMIEDGRLTRIDIVASHSAGHPSVATEHDIAVGSTMKDLRRAYGNILTIQKSDSNPGYLEVIAAVKGNHRLVFSVFAKRVTSLRAGVMPSAMYPEGCS